MELILENEFDFNSEATSSIIRIVLERLEGLGDTEIDN